jgi:alkylation response protein AidB-like acyl-CoA dehydrogenase
MKFSLNEDQVALQKAAAEFLVKECPYEVVFASFESDDGDAPDLYKKMAELGWLALAVPEEHDGLGMGLVEQAVLAEQLGYFNAPGPFFSNACLAVPLLLALGATEELPSVIDGSRRLALVTDPSFVIDGGIADDFLVATSDEIRLVPGSEAEVTPHETIDGTRRTARVDIAEGAGKSLGSTEPQDAVLDAARAALAAETVGGMQHMLDTTVAFAKDREQFGREIGSFQVVKHRLADMLIRTEAARSAAYYAAWANSVAAPDAARSASVAKAYASESAVWVTGQAIQLHGGIGYTWEHHAHLYFKRATMNAEFLGDAASNRSRALALLG